MAPAGGSAYLDSSIFLAILFRESIARDFLIRLGESPVASEIADLECRRTLDRVRIEERLGDEEVADRVVELEKMLQATRIVPLSSAVLKRAKAPFPTVVRSLDAIHLATAELVGAGIFLSRDRQQLIAAKAMGFEVLKG